MWFREFFPPSRPRAARGGIKAQSKRGAFGESWWAKRWIEVLESFDVGGRLQRGRSYARSGQVLSLDIQNGKVAARVQGSDPRPYAVSIELKHFAEKDWAKVTDALAGQAAFAAKLLAGQMPPEIEQVARDAGVSLFPSRANDLETDCSCPDWSNPCKHVAAVYYLLAEEFDRDPFLVFRLRGLEREALFERLNRSGLVQPSAATPREAPEAPEPLPTDPTAFWSAGELPPGLFGDVAVPPAPAGLPRRLGSPSFWRGNKPFLETMEEWYQAASQRGLETYLDVTDDSLSTAVVPVSPDRRRSP